MTEKAQAAIDGARELLPELAATLKNVPTFDAAGIKAAFAAFAEERG